MLKKIHAESSYTHMYPHVALSIMTSYKTIVIYQNQAIDNGTIQLTRL